MIVVPTMAQSMSFETMVMRSSACRNLYLVTG